ncbi:hypothetical protein AWH62_00655 [Maricaulis sp. W15]|uniref:hypothetical protein n=1 Tax=Maricaulis sp. W15 TaxID=1772333 RepID=UPI000948B8AB|nr:hypothetical protein [Maricaulis sp. W15]OLF81221.1 hypothetical protein AWH62_00655 [Maricaulis sp. W15]
MTKTLKTMLALTACALPLAACGGNTEQPVGPDSPARSGSDAPQVVMEQNVGGLQSQAGANLNLPAGFPDDVAHYPDLNIYGANTIPNMGFSLAALADGSPDDVAAFYAREMTALGWTEAANAPSGPGHMLRFEKDGRVATFNLIPNGSTTTLSVTVLN